MAAGLILVVAAAAIACGGAGDAVKLTELQRLRSGPLDILLLSPHDALHHGKDDFLIEFRTVSSGDLVDVGKVRVSATMPMPGMPMFGAFTIAKTDVAGRYTVNGELGMAGTWRLTIEWDGSAGQGSVSFPGTVL